jgi:hypothetical protein
LADMALNDAPAFTKLVALAGSAESASSAS